MWLALCLLFCFFIDVQNLIDHSVFYIFQLRDIERARSLLSGHLIFFGPEMTGGGNLPGPLYYYILACTFFIKNSWIAVWVMQLAFAITAVIVGYTYFEKEFKSKATSILWLFMFATAPLTSWFLKIFLNVSFLIPFVVLSLVLTIKSFESADPVKRKKYYLLNCLILSLGLQLHLSLIFFVSSLLFLNFFAEKLNLPKLSKKDFFLGLAFFIVPLIPYLLWIVLEKMKISFGDPGFYAGKEEGSIKSLFFLIEQGVSGDKGRLIKQWIQKFIFTFPASILLLLFVVDLKMFYKKNKPLLIIFLFSLIPFLNWLFSPQAIRYTMLAYITSQFVAVKMFHEVLNNKVKIKEFVIFGAGGITILALVQVFSFPRPELGSFSLRLIAVVLLIFFLGSKLEKKDKLYSLSAMLIFILMNSGYYFLPRFNYLKFNDRETYMPTVKDWSHIWKTVHDKTGWSYAEARKRIYYIGHHMSQSPKLAFEASSKNFTQGRDGSKVNMPDGFFVSNRYSVQVAKNSEVQWLLLQNIPNDIKSGIRNKQIEFGKNLSEHIMVMPYWIKKSNFNYEYFQNTSEGYKYLDDDLVLQNSLRNNGVVEIAPYKYLFKWNECIDLAEYCSTGAIVEMKKINSNFYSFHVKIVGSALSQITPWISPSWTQAWINPYIQIECGSVLEKFIIASNVGFTRKYSHGDKNSFFQGNNSILAPFERTFNLQCSCSPTAIEIGRDGSYVDKVREVVTLAGKSLKVKIN